MGNRFGACEGANGAINPWRCGGAALLLTLLLVVTNGAAGESVFRPPASVSVEVEATGRANGIIAVANLHAAEGAGTVRLEQPGGLLPGTAAHQGLLALPGPAVEVAAGDSVSVELEGYCTDVRKPAPDAGTPLPPGRWTPGMMPLPERFRAPPRSQSPARGAPVLAATFPGELRTIEAHWEPDDHPSFTTALLLRCLERIGPALSRLRDSDTFVTPYSDEPEKERRILTQQVLWLYLALIRDHVYGKSAFEAALARQLEQVLDVPFTEWPAEDQETFVYGADDLWSATLHLAKEAKLLRSLE